MEEIQEISALIENIPRFMGTLFENLESDSDIKLNNTEEKTLIVLLKDKNRPMIDYSRKLGLTKGYFTCVADNLENKGLIERKTDSNDRRIFQITLTEQGRMIAEKIDRAHNRHITAKIASLESEDLEKLRNALETIHSITLKLKQGKGNK